MCNFNDSRVRDRIGAFSVIVYFITIQKSRAFAFLSCVGLDLSRKGIFAIGVLFCSTDPSVIDVSFVFNLKNKVLVHQSASFCSPYFPAFGSLDACRVKMQPSASFSSLVLIILSFIIEDSFAYFVTVSE